jgi:hypothetical protein
MAERARVPVGLKLFLLFQALYALTSAGWVFRVADEFETYFQVEQLVDAGDLSVPQARELRIFFGKVARDGKPYAPYGPLAAPLALPHHLAGRAVARLAGIDREKLGPWRVIVGGLTSLATATAAALAVAGFHRAATALGAPARRAVVLSLLLGGATVLWPYGTCFFAEAHVAALFVWATALLVEARASRRPPFLAALLVFAAVLVKATSVIVTPAFLVAIAVERSLTREQRARALALVALGIGAALVVHASWNLKRFGSPFDFGYDWSETITKGETPRPFALEELPRGLVVLLLTPGKSLVLWAPALVLAATRARAFAAEDRAAALGIATALGLSLLFFGSYMFPEGGTCHGPRHLVPIVPLLLLVASAKEGCEPTRAAVLGCAVAGLVFALGAVSVSYLEDQAMGDDLAHPRTTYYERVTAAKGRPWNRYQLGYVPFVETLASGDLASTSRRAGTGLDLFALHVARARTQLPDGASIPAWLPWALSLPWLALLVAAGASLGTALVPRPEEQ